MSTPEVYQRLAEKIFVNDSVIVPRLFEMIADDKEAEMLMSLPGTIDQATESTGLAVDEAREMLDTLFYKGLVFKKKKEEGVIYRMCRDIMQFHDATILWPDAPREFLDMWQKYMDEEWPGYAETVDKILPKPVTRIIPVGESVDATQKILAYEDVKSVIEGARKIAVTNCTCRMIAQKCDKPLEVCLQIDRAADYTLERGTGRELTKEEAMEKVRISEEAGLIHVTMNRADNMHFICNCCDDCCQAFPLIITKGLNLCDPSRFRASVDPELCSGCETCVERCYFGAIAMNDDEVAVVDPGECVGCGLCQVTCPERAIKLVTVRDEEFIPS